MTRGKAISIVKNILQYDGCDAEKIAAIIVVRDMATINSITKDELRDVIRFLINRLPMLFTMAAGPYLSNTEDLPHE